MKEIKILIGCAIMCAITSCCIVYWVINRGHQNQIAVIDAVKLFDSYNMKKELEEIAKGKLQAESNKLDSMGKVIQVIKASKGNDEEIKMAMYSYNTMKAKLQDDYTQSNQEINDQVWKRLNPLLDEYGKTKNLHLIIGANGMGSVLYTDGFYDQTNEAIEFINQKYAGKN